MNFEIVRTTEFEAFGEVKCRLGFTSEFEEYNNSTEENYEDLEGFEEGLIDALDNMIKANKIKNDVEAVAYIEDEDFYLYVDATDEIYPLAVLPIGSSKKYRICAVSKFY